MLNTVLGILCSFLVSISVIFIVVEFRSKFDRSFLIFGITNILLAMYCGIDIWLQPDFQIIYWTRVQHCIAAFFPVLLLWYLTMVLDKENRIVFKVLMVVSTVFCMLFFTRLMLKPSSQEIVSTLLYNVTFIPYMLASILYLIGLLIVNYPKSSGSVQKIILFHFFGLTVLAAGGVLDMVTVVIGRRIVPQVATFAVPGLLLFGISVTTVFINRLASIIQDREVMFNKLQLAYKELVDVQALKELGQSSAMISHEIKNYTFAISGYTHLLQKENTMTEKQQRMVSAIAGIARSMSEFSKGILDFSKTKILSDKKPLNLSELLQICITRHFAIKQSQINIEHVDKAAIIHGDRDKLEHVFVNLFNNAFEADGSTVTIKTLKSESVLLVLVEDDGVGCSEVQLSSLFKSFYTTKKSSGGTGLGMCITRSIIEGHGGHISAYSKNILDNGSHGLYLALVFPLYNEPEKRNKQEKDPIVLISDNLCDFAPVDRLFQRILVNPYVFTSVDEIDLKRSELGTCAVFGSAESIESLKTKFNHYNRNHILMQLDAKSVTFVMNADTNRSRYQLSEQYVLESLLV